MFKRFVIVLGLFFLIVGGIGYYKYSQIQKVMKQGGFVPPPDTVTAVVTKEESWAPVLTAIGSLEPVNGVNVSTDLGGIVRSIGFESGKSVNTGEILVQLDTTQEEAALRSAQARSDLAQINRTRIKALWEKKTSSKSEFDSAEAEARQAQAAVDEQKALIARKTIRAPFAGLAGIRRVNIGQYVNPGDSLVSVTSLDPIYVNFSLPQQNTTILNEGRAVSVKVDGVADQAFEGQITALNSMVDSSTRNIEIQATIRNPDGKLRPGMFAKVEVELPKAEKVIAIPATSVAYAPYGDSVFVISDGKDATGKPAKIVTPKTVKLGDKRGDQVSVISGLKPGEQVVTSGVFKLRPGGAVLVNDKIQPGNDPNPKPSDS
ncbi:MAG TPA: efflux RND transporter periplasmic adaptor subunit [Chthoniobacterales bacterium]